MSVSTAKERIVSIDSNNRVKIEVVDDPTHHARVHVTDPTDQRWEFIVTEDRNVKSVGVFDGQRRLPEQDRPDWMGDVLLSIGLDVTEL